MKLSSYLIFVSQKISWLSILMFFLRSKGGGRYNTLVLICSLLFRSTFFLLRESLLAADRDFFLSVHKVGELHVSSIFWRRSCSPGQPLLWQTPVSLAPLCIISFLCYPQPPLSQVSYKHCVPRVLQEAFLSSSAAEERWCFQSPLPTGSFIVPQGGKRKWLFINRGSKYERTTANKSEQSVHWMSHETLPKKLVLQEKEARNKKKNHVGSTEKHSEKYSISSSDLIVAYFYTHLLRWCDTGRLLWHSFLGTLVSIWDTAYVPCS